LLVFNTNPNIGSPLQTNQNPTNIKKINNLQSPNNNSNLNSNTYSYSNQKNQLNLGSNRYKNPKKIESAEKSNIPNGIIFQEPILYGNKIENFQRQQILRRLLKEFGLGQYLRVIFILKK
jgi:hypothetical protein